MKKQQYEAPSAELFMSYPKADMLQVTKVASFILDDEAEWGDDVIDDWVYPEANP